MKALVVIADGIEELETVTITDLLVRGGIQVTLASVNGLQVTAARGLKLTADDAITGISDDFDVVICPGGNLGAQNLAACETLKSLLASRHQKRQWIAAICASPAVVLEPWGILDGRGATCFPALEHELVDYRDLPVVVDGHIITSQGPATSAQFALTIVQKLQGDAVAKDVAKNALYRF